MESENERFWRTFAEQKRADAEELAAAKAEAAGRGKEPFDLAALEAKCDTSHGGLDIPVEERHAEYEYLYYVCYPQFVTMREMVDLVRVLNEW
ncbi:MAG: hypothetical protein U0324_25285 [Polyangiales bacterium]